MKFVLSYIIFLLIPFYVKGQHGKVKTDDQKLFDKATGYYYDDNYDSALLVFHKFIETYPNSDLKGRAHYNLGYINFQKENYDEAKQIFLNILQQKYNEHDPNGLMEQYTLYKHKSCEHLAEIYLKESNYTEALRYTKLFDKKYPYKHFCGNELRAYDIYRARCYARVFEGQKTYAKAIRTLLPYLFNDGLASNAPLLEDLTRIVDRIYTKDYLNPELNKAISGFKIKKTKHKEYGLITIFGTKVKVYYDALFELGNPDFEANSKLDENALYHKAILTNAFFKQYL